MENAGETGQLRIFERLALQNYKIGSNATMRPSQKVSGLSQSQARAHKFGKKGKNPPVFGRRELPKFQGVATNIFIYLYI